MRAGRVVYWFLAGACLGMGLVPTALGIFLLAIGVILLLIGVFARRGREAVAAVLGLGAGPLALFAYIAYINGQGAPLTGSVAQLVYGGLIISGAVTLIGLVALVVVWRTQRRGAGPAAT